MKKDYELVRPDSETSGLEARPEIFDAGKPIEKGEPKVVNTELERQRQRQEERDAREMIESSFKQTAGKPYDPYEKFKNYIVSENGVEVIKLPQEAQRELEGQVYVLQIKDRFLPPGLIKGNPTAKKYSGGDAANYSTKTHIVGDFMVIDRYPASVIHTWLNNFSERRVGIRSHKVSRSEWKDRYVSRSTVPTIDIGNKNAIAMPFIENVNMRDWFSCSSTEIKKWEGADWAKDVDLEKKKQMIPQIVREIEAVHRKGGAWGNAGLENMIFDPNGKVYVCDPESKFDKDMPEVERRAFDLKDIIFTAATTLAKSEGFTDFGEVVRLVLESYSNKEVVVAAVEAAKEKPSFVNKMFFGYTQARYGFKDFKQHEAIRMAIASYSAEGNEKKS